MAALRRLEYKASWSKKTAYEQSLYAQQFAVFLELYKPVCVCMYGL